MAARRLLIVMLILLAFSTIASVLVPTRESSDDEAATTDSVATLGESTAPGETAPAQAEASPAPPEIQPVKISIGGPKLPVVPLLVGQQLTLKVFSQEPGLLEIPALGLVEAVSPELPATFYVLAAQPANYGIRLLEDERVVARIEVSAPGAAKEARKPRVRAEPGSAS